MLSVGFPGNSEKPGTVLLLPQPALAEGFLRNPPIQPGALVSITWSVLTLSSGEGRAAKRGADGEGAMGSASAASWLLPGSSGRGSEGGCLGLVPSGLGVAE